MSELILHERNNGDERCSFNWCRKPYDVRYLPRASVLNPKKLVQICEGHHPEFLRMAAEIQRTEKDLARLKKKGKGRKILRRKILILKPKIKRKELKVHGTTEAT